MKVQTTKVRWRIFWLACVGQMFYAPLYGQGAANPAATAIVVPGGFEPKVRALGDRYTSPGKERITLLATIQIGTGLPLPAAIIYELPGKFSFVAGLDNIVFNGLKSVFSQQTSSDLATVETLFEDSIDGLLHNISNASLFRNLVNRARMDDGTAKNYSGPFVDIYQVMATVRSLPGAPNKTKHYYFDSNTQLLDHVTFVDTTAGQVVVEEQYRNWTTQNGVPVPKAITRIENGVTRFAVNVQTITIGGLVNDGIFTLP